MFPQIFGKYVLERELASGGMARVYLATLRGAVGFEKRLVVKQIRPELASDQAFVRRFVEEAKTTVELSHPNIVPVYELGVEQGVYYIAMELCSGVTLAEILTRTGPLSPEEGAYLGVEICRALDYAHRRAGIVHRDVTPRNVLIDEEGAVRLIDFGIAAPAAESGPHRSEIFGSPGHMPPEQLAGKPLSPATDVFAVAVLLFEAWTRKAVFRRATAKASQRALDEPVPRLSEEVPALASLSELLARGLALDPTERPAHAELFARPLRDFLRNVDAGDVARRLGARVRRAERRAKRGDSSIPPSTPSVPSSPLLEGGPFDSSGVPEPTYTFAAREEVASWTRAIGVERASSPSSIPPPPREGGSGPSTRKLPSLPPTASSSPPPRSRPGGDPTRPSAPPGEAVERRAPASPPPDAPPATTSGVAAASSGGSWRVFALGVALAAGVTLVVGVTGERPRAGERASATAVSVAPRSSAVAPPPAERTTARAEPEPIDVEPPTSDLPLAAPTVRSPSPRPTAASARAPSSAAPSAGGGLLRLTADPAAAVSVQGPAGSRAFTTPVRELKLPTGIYVLTFRNDTYPEPVVARVLLDAGQERSVHVDFRDVEPRVSVR